MKIQIAKFGNILVSRPAGKDAFLAASAYIFKDNEKEFILDFAGAEVLTPSWADEFIGGIKGKFKNVQIKFDNTLNPSVKETLDIIKA